MRRIITALLVLLTTSAIAQNGGQITGKKNSGLTGTVMVDSVALKVSDSASRVYLSAMKLKSDSIYKRMYQDSVNLAKLGTGVTITGSVTANLDVTDSTNIAGINSKLGGTLTVSLPTGASTETTLSALNSKVPSGLSTAGNRLAIYSPDSIRVFATNGFGSGGSGGTTSLDAVDSTNLANTATNTSRLPSGLTVTSTRLLVDGSGVTQPVSLSGNVNTTISDVTKKTLSTQIVSADTGLVVNAVMHGLTTGGGGGYHDVKVTPSGALTVEATLDSATQRSTIQVSGHDSTTDSRLGVKLLVNPTITNDSSTLSRSTINISNFPATQAVTGTFTSSVPTYSVSGTITTQNLTPTRTATAGSAVLALCDGYATASIKVRGGYTGALTAQFSNDDSTWTTPSTNLLYRYTVSGAGASSSISSGDTSLYFMPTMGAKRIRLTGLSAMTGTATVFIVLNTANNIVYINPSQSVVVTNTLLASGASGGYKLEDAASASGDGGSFIMGIRSDTLTSTPSSANGDYTQFSVTKNGSLLIKDEMRHRVTYRASSGSFSPAALATDIFTISGVASKTIMITKIIFSATQTAGSTFNVALIKRSTANTSGTATAMTAVPLDASDAAAGSTVQYYTANPTLGTTIGSVETAPIFCSTTATQPEKYVFDFGLRSKPIILNSASQALSINLGGVTMTGGACFVTIEWTETW
jgi:hypothetical protein